MACPRLNVRSLKTHNSFPLNTIILRTCYCLAKKVKNLKQLKNWEHFEKKTYRFSFPLGFAVRTGTGNVAEKGILLPG